MASYTMHLAIAKLYLEKNSENEMDFYKGTIDVDDVPHKIISHYSDYSIGEASKLNIQERMNLKVNLKRYVDENTIETSYDRGYFLHLLADYYFYKNYFTNNDLEKIKANGIETLYREYDILNGYLIEKYDLKIPQRLDKKYFRTTKGDLEITTYSSINDFIEFVSNLDLKNLYNKIKNSESILNMYERKDKIC